MIILRELARLLNVEIIWKFFATSHGKGVVDGIGGKAKSTVRQQVLSQKKGIVVQNAKDFVSVASKNLKGIEMREVKPESIDGVDQSMWEDAPSVPGVAIAHVMCFKRNGLCKLYKNNIDYLLDVDPIFETFFDGMEDGESEETLRVEDFESVDIGDWVVVNYDNKRFPGKVTRKNVNGMKVKVMKPSFPSDWTWPVRKDEIDYTFENILKKIDPPFPLNSRCSKWGFKDPIY